MQQLGAALGGQAAQHRQHARQRGLARRAVERVEACAAEHLHLAALALPGQPGLCALNQVHRVFVAGAGRFAPAEQAVATEHDAAQAGVRGVVGGQALAQFVARTQPGHPAHGALVHLAGDRLAVGHGRDRDHGVRVHVVHVCIGQRGVQRGVDGGRAGVEVEGAVRQVAHHLVFVLQAAVQALERAQLVHVERGEAVELHGAHVAARALDPEHFGVGAAQGVALPDLGRGVAPAVVGDAQVRTEQVGAVQKQMGLVHAGGRGVVPLGKVGGGGCVHGTGC